MGFFKRKYEEAKAEVKEEWRHRQELKAREKTSRRSEQLAQAEQMGKKKEQIKAAEELKRYKAKQKQRSQPFKGFAGPTQSKPNAALGVANYLTGSNGKKKKGKNPLDNMRIY